jgi:hypothetical protein
MKIKQLALHIVVTLFTFQSIYCINLQDIDFAIAQPLEIAQAIASHSAKVIAAKTFETGIANIPLANLELLLAHEQIGAKIVSRMNYINDITKKNVHLFIQPIADNFDHINQHTLDWILYLKPDNIEPIVSIFVKNFSVIYEDDNGAKALLNLLKNYPNPHDTKQFIQPAVNNFISLAYDSEGRDIIVKIMELHPDSAQLFVQPVLNDFLSLANDHYGHDIVMKIMEVYPDSAKQFTQPAIDHFIALSQNKDGHKVILRILELYPDSGQSFIQLTIDNFLTLSKNKNELEIKILELYPEATKLLVQTAIDNISIWANDYYGKQLLTKLIEHNPQVQKSLDNYHFTSKIKSKIKEGLILTGTFIGSLAIAGSIGCATGYATVKFIVPAIKYLRMHTMGIIQ